MCTYFAFFSWLNLTHPGYRPRRPSVINGCIWIRRILGTLLGNSVQRAFGREASGNLGTPTKTNAENRVPPDITSAAFLVLSPWPDWPVLQDLRGSCILIFPEAIESLKHTWWFRTTILSKQFLFPSLSAWVAKRLSSQVTDLGYIPWRDSQELSFLCTGDWPSVLHRRSMLLHWSSRSLLSVGNGWLALNSEDLITIGSSKTVKKWT